MSQNFSAEYDTLAILQNLNDDKAKIWYGAIIFMGILCLVGVVGNLHVLIIHLRLPKSNVKIFICFLAVIDLVSCGIDIPFNIVMCSYPLMYYNDASCKIFKYLGGCVLVGTGLLLLTIAVERYRKICKPFSRQVSLKQVKILCVVVLAVAVLLPTHALFLYGSTEVSTKHLNITGYECHIKAELQDTVYRHIHIGIIFTGSLGSCTALTVLYILIGVKIWQHQAKMRRIKERVPSKATDQSERKTVLEIAPESHSDTEDVASNQSETSEQDTSFTSSSHKCNQTHKRQNAVEINEDQFNQMKRTTYMFILISSFCILSFIPYPALRIYQFFNKDWYDSLNLSELNGVNVALSTYFLNNVVNIFVYIGCDPSFRRNLISCYSNIFCRERDLR